MLEVGVERYRAIKDFREAAARVQTGNKVPFARSVSATASIVSCPPCPRNTPPISAMRIGISCLIDAVSVAVTQPAFVFAGEQFDSDPDLKLARSMLLDFFRGRTVENINLKVQRSLEQKRSGLFAGLPRHLGVQCLCCGTAAVGQPQVEFCFMPGCAHTRQYRQQTRRKSAVRSETDTQGVRAPLSTAHGLLWHRGWTT